MSILPAETMKKLNISVSKMLVGLLHHSQNWSWTCYCKYFPFWVLCFPPYSQGEVEECEGEEERKEEGKVNIDKQCN